MKPRILTTSFVTLVVRVFTVAAILAMAVSAHAEITLPNLPSGSQYQLVFVTQDTHDAVSTNIDDYNSFVSQQAALNASLPSGLTWRVLGSTQTVDAIDNAATYDSIPIYDTRGHKIADGRADLWDHSIQNPIAYDQYGDYAGNTFVFTGTAPDGTCAVALGDFIFNSGSTWWSSVAGRADFTSSEWICYGMRDYATLEEAQAVQRPFYGLSSPITIPEPASIVLLVVGGMAVWMWQRLRAA